MDCIKALQEVWPLGKPPSTFTTQNIADIRSYVINFLMDHHTTLNIKKLCTKTTIKSFTIFLKPIALSYSQILFLTSFIFWFFLINSKSIIEYLKLSLTNTILIFRNTKMYHRTHFNCQVLQFHTSHTHICSYVINSLMDHHAILKSKICRTKTTFKSIFVLEKKEISKLLFNGNLDKMFFRLSCNIMILHHHRREYH